VKRDCRKALNDYIDALPGYRSRLESANAQWTEGEYNAYAASRDSRYILLDKATVKVSGHASPVEICDLLSDDGDFIHIKGKLRSSALSHLFTQGYVSADLLVRSPDYRRKVRKKVETVLSGESDEVRESFAGVLSRLDEDAFSPKDFRIVYGIIADWDDRSASAALPYSSKVNLRLHAEDLKRMGFKVALKPIQVVAAKIPSVPGI